MTVQYAVTFEFELRPPVTYRGTLAARGAHTCASRAIKVAQKALRPINWTSMVFVVLERGSGPSDTAEPDYQSISGAS